MAGKVYTRGTAGPHAQRQRKSRARKRASQQKANQPKALAKQLRRMGLLRYQQDAVIATMLNRPRDNGSVLQMYER